MKASNQQLRELKKIQTRSRIIRDLRIRIAELIGEVAVLKDSRRAAVTHEQTSRNECNRLRGSLNIKNKFLDELLQVTWLLDNEEGHYTKATEQARKA